MLVEIWALPRDYDVQRVHSLVGMQMPHAQTSRRKHEALVNTCRDSPPWGALTSELV